MAMQCKLVYLVQFNFQNHILTIISVTIILEIDIALYFDPF